MNFILVYELKNKLYMQNDEKMLEINDEKCWILFLTIAVT